LLLEGAKPKTNKIKTDFQKGKEICQQTHYAGLHLVKILARTDLKQKKSPFATCSKKFHNPLKRHIEVACNVKADKQFLDGRQGSSLFCTAIFCHETNQQH